MASIITERILETEVKPCGKLSTMELRHLESFCMIASEMHVTRAAERLNIAQPALTQQLRLLEKELGFPLVRRTGRGIALTEAGEFFYREAEQILQRLGRARLEASEIAHGKENRIVVGMTEAFAYSPLLSSVFSRFRAEWPDVELALSQNQANKLGNDLKDGSIDAAFTCPISDADATLKCTRLAEDRMILAVPTVHRFAQRSSVSLPELREEPLILVAHDQIAGAFEGTLRSGCRSHGFTPRIVQTSPRLMLTLNLVAAGVGLSFVPEYMSRVPLDDLCYVPIQDSFPLVFGIMFVTRTHEVSPRLDGLREIAMQAFTRVDETSAQQAFATA